MEIKLSRTTIILGIVSLVIGFFLNYLANKIANDKLLAQIHNELNAVNQQQNHTKSGSVENNLLDKRKIELQAQIDLLKKI